MAKSYKGLLFKHLANGKSCFKHAMETLKLFLKEPKTIRYLFIDKNGYKATEKVRTRSEAVLNV